MKRIWALATVSVLTLGFGCGSDSGKNGEDSTATGHSTSSDSGTGSETGGVTQDEDTGEDIGSVTEDAGTSSEPKPEQLRGNPCDASANPWDCSPVGDSTCGADQACDWAVASKIGSFACRDNRTLAEGETCKPQASKCGPGLKCMEPFNACVRYCCSDADCEGTGFMCEWHDTFPKAVEGGQLGLCYRPQLVGDVCEGDNPWECDPVSNDGCDPGYACQFGSSDGLVVEFKCIESGPLTEGNSCSVEDGYLCEPGLACVDHICRRFCCGDDECGQGVQCKYEAYLEPKYTGGSLGFCVPSNPPCPGECTIQMDLSQYGYPVCENGTVYKNYFDCPEPDKTGCCKSVDEAEIGKPCPVPGEGEGPNGFECKGALDAVFGHCPAVHHEYLCPDAAGGKKQWCCELDPKMSSVFDEPGSTDSDIL